MTITAASLAAAGNRSSAAITTDITKNVTAIMLSLTVYPTATAPTGNKQIVVYAYKSGDGTHYNGAGSTVDNVDGTDKALTAIGSPSNLIQIGTIQLNQGAVSTPIDGEFEISGPLGCIPKKWGIVLFNDAGVALSSTNVVAVCTEQYYV